ncbi:hypothetical protein EB061_12560, partial [bacterium]|nr:hypothetical protein [bacterium]
FQIANVVHYARIVRDKALQRRLIETCSSIMEDGLSGVENTENYIDLAETKIFEVSQTKAQRSFTSLAEVISGNMTRVQELFMAGGEEVVGLPTGFTDFDKITTGLHPGQVMVLAARPGMGKTSWFISALLHSAVMKDYLQLMKGPKTASAGGNREQEISAISRGLKELAKEIGVPIIALSQLSRSVEGRTDKRPMLSDLRESGAIEQDADLVCFIYRDDYYNSESEEKGVAEIILAKNRHGEPGTVKLAWLGQYTLFANLTEEEAPASGPVQRRPSTNPDDISL